MSSPRITHPCKSSLITGNASSFMRAYSPSDIYNADETELFHAMMPRKTLHFKGLWCNRGKQRESAPLFCSAQTWSDLQAILVIGYSAKLHCFRSTRQYVANSRSWMTWVIFIEWLVDFDKEMERQARNIRLFVDNYSAHRIDDVELTNVELNFFFYQNALHSSNPLDQGMIQSVRRT